MAVNGEVYRNDYHSKAGPLHRAGSSKETRSSSSQILPLRLTPMQQQTCWRSSTSTCRKTATLQPIENFGGQLKRKVYKDSWKAETEQQLRQHIQLCPRTMDWEAVQAQMATLKTRAMDNGLNSEL